jgi:uncharacterized low-complexity protein
MKYYSLRFFGRSIIGASLLALAIPAQAEEKSAEVTTKFASATEGGKAAAKEEKLICKRLPDSTSRMKSVRACHTKADWRKLEDGQF